MVGMGRIGRTRDWDDLIAKHKSGDQVYFVDCKRVDPSRIVAGTSLYVLVRDGAVIARAAGDESRSSGVIGVFLEASTKPQTTSRKLEMIRIARRNCRKGLSDSKELLEC